MRIIDKATIRVQDWRRVPAAGPGASGFRGEKDGESDVTYVVELNESEIKQLAIRAARNRNQCSVSGPIRVRVLKRQKVAPDV